VSRTPIRWIVVAAGVLALVTGIAAWSARRTLLERALLRQGRDWGLDELRLEVERLDLDGLVLRNIAVGAQLDLSVDVVEIAFSPSGLVAGELDLVQIEGLRLRTALSEGAALSDGTALADGGTVGAGSAATPVPPVGLRALPARELVLRDARLEFDTPQGPLEIALELRASRDGETRGEAELRHAWAHGVMHLEGDASGAGVAGSFAGSFEGEDVAAFGLGFERAALDLRGEWHAEEGGVQIALRDCARLRVVGLSLAESFALHQPLELCVEAEPGLSLGTGEGGAPFADATFSVAAAPVSGVVGGADTSMRFEGEVPELQVHIQSDGLAEGTRVELQSRGGRVAIPLYELEVRGLQSDIAFDSGSALPKGEIHLQEIFHTQRRADWPVLEMTGSFAPESTGEEERLKFSLILSDVKRILRLHLDGDHELSTGSGRTRIELEPIHFTAAGPQPSDLIPSLGDAVSLTAGSAELEGGFSWSSGGEPEGHADLTLSELVAVGEAAAFHGVSGVTRILGPFSPSTPPHQKLTVERMAAGVELTDGVVEWQLEPHGSIELEGMHWKFAGGEIRGRGSYDPLVSEGRLFTEVQSIDVAKLLEIADLEGLTGTGRLSGDLPLRYRDNRIEILPATLKAQRLDGFGGWIRYRPTTAGAMAESKPGLGTLYGALKDFHYEELSLDLRGDLLGEVELGVYLKGSNPDFHGGRAVEFNLNVETALVDLIRGATTAYQLPETLSEKLRKRVDGRSGGR
jgi:hypothetical protein